jgi:hypothetical protein
VGLAGGWPRGVVGLAGGCCVCANDGVASATVSAAARMDNFTTLI